ncbi:MAG: hypothetical protein E6J31_07395 [Chloroflexi bacterium]|nr:MAG: hypothetical protein E6J31_07395 [Chloroflexota bacterium]
MEEGRQIDQEVRHEFKRTGDVIHGLASIVAHDERVRGQWPGAVGTWFFQARHACQTEMVSVHDEHGFLLHLKRCQRTQSSLDRAPITDQV